MTFAQTALRYAKALHDSAASAAMRDADSADMARLATILASVPGLARRCSSLPGGRVAASHLVELAFAPHVGERLGRALALMARNGRLGAIPHLAEAWDRVQAEARGEIDVLVETAHEPDADMMAAIGERMSRRLDSAVRISQRVEPSLIGGFRILWRDRLIDCSLAGRARSLRRHFASQPFAGSQ